jgi:hypothetical protein
VRKTDPGSFTYSWYPSLTSAAYGIGATGDYWLHNLRAADTAYGVIATVQARDAALPDPPVTDDRFGPSLVTQPLPGTESGLRWRLGKRSKARNAMTLKLTDVSALSLDAAEAKLKTGTITLVSDHAARFTIFGLPRGTEVLERGHRVATAGRNGTAVVSVHRGTTVLTLVRPAAARGRTPARRGPVPAPSFTG